MKNLIFSLLLICVATLSLSANPIKYEERLNTLKKVKLLEFMELNEEKGNKLLSILDSFDEKKHRLHEKLKELSIKIEDSFAEMTENECKEINNQIVAIHDSIANVKIEKSNRIRKLLSEKEFTKFTLFEYKFVKELRKRLIKRKSRRRNKN
jgi:hypothetical protein